MMEMAAVLKETLVRTYQVQICDKDSERYNRRYNQLISSQDLCENGASLCSCYGLPHKKIVYIEIILPILIL